MKNCKEKVKKNYALILSRSIYKNLKGVKIRNETISQKRSCRLANITKANVNVK